MSSIPATVTDPIARDFYEKTNEIRAQIKAVALVANGLRLQLCGFVLSDGEGVANATLAYRHLEDASMRLGKVLQALDGGVSVYDKATTVGAPDPVNSQRPVNRAPDGSPIYGYGTNSPSENGGAGESGGLLNTDATGGG